MWLESNDKNGGRNGLGGHIGKTRKEMWISSWKIKRGKGVISCGGFYYNWFNGVYLIIICIAGARVCYRTNWNIHTFTVFMAEGTLMRIAGRSSFNMAVACPVNIWIIMIRSHANLRQGHALGGKTNQYCIDKYVFWNFHKIVIYIFKSVPQCNI